MRDLRDRLLAEQEAFLNGDRLGAAVDAILAQGGEDPAGLAAAFTARFRLPTPAEAFDPTRIKESKKGVKERTGTATATWTSATCSSAAPATSSARS